MTHRTLALAVLLVLGLAGLYLQSVIFPPTKNALTALDVAELKSRLADAADGDRPIRSVLFIGNSHTYVNDVPRLVERIAKSHPSNPYQYVTAMIARGGANLSIFTANPKVQDIVTQIDWDYIVLQDQSTAALFDHKRVAFQEAVSWFEQQAAPGHAKLVLYATWPRLEGDVLYSYGSNRRYRGTRSPLEMNRTVEEQYELAATQNQVVMAPVGACWLAAPVINILYSNDGNHATIEGSYLAALVLFRSISRLSPAETVYRPWFVSSATAESLRQTASDC